MQGDTKKFKVYVKNPKGNVVKVNFGQGGDAKGGTMRIRKSNPEGVNLRDPGSWLVMARTNYMLDEIERDIRLQGMLYKRNNKLPI